MIHLCRSRCWIKMWKNYYLKEILMRKMMKKKDHGDRNHVYLYLFQWIENKGGGLTWIPLLSNSGICEKKSKNGEQPKRGQLYCPCCVAAKRRCYVFWAWCSQSKDAKLYDSGCCEPSWSYWIVNNIHLNVSCNISVLFSCQILNCAY